MRGIFTSYLTLGLMLLLLAQPGSAQNVTVQLTPITYPIVLPDSGGSFDYLLFVTNQGSTPVTATIWCTVTLPGGGFWGPVAGPASQTLAAGQTLGYYRIQSIPTRAPAGAYSFNAYIGIYPNTIWDRDNFPFEKTLAGYELWVARYNGQWNNVDRASSLAVDGGGNVYVTGESYGSGNNWDYATVKYDANGNALWVARYNGPVSAFDGATSLAVDGGGNVYVTGWSIGSGTSWDYATIKYDANGNQLWVARYNGPGNSYDYAYSLAVDGGGSVYVTGTSVGSGLDWDYATIKYDPSGNQLWVARYNGPGNSYDHANSLAVDGGGNVYVAGYSWGSGTSADYATIKYDSLGNQLWEARYNGPGNGNDIAYSLTVDGGGNVYVTGGSNGTISYYSADYATIKYDASGNQLWVTRYDGPGNGWDEANSLAVDSGGSVYVTGWSAGNGTSYDYATIKYDASGNQLWLVRYDGPGNLDDEAYSLAMDGGGNVYVTGKSTGNGTNYDYATIEYDAFGNQLWLARYNGPANGLDSASSIVVDGENNVYVTGTSMGSGTNYDYATIKYSGGNIANWMPVEATVFGQPLPQECRLEQNFPNPFNATTAISYKLQAASYVSLKVYDTAGRLVETLVDGWRAAGMHELTWDASQMPSGIYFARLKSGDYVGVQKMILLK